MTTVHGVWPIGALATVNNVGINRETGTERLHDTAPNA